VKIDAHSYKAFRESLRGDRLIKLINLMLRSAECGIKIFGVARESFRLRDSNYEKVILTICCLVRLRLGSLVLV